VTYVSIQIEGLSDSDNLRLTLQLMHESIKPSRCPKCESANVTEEICVAGSLCNHDCGGGGWRISCKDCSVRITEAECEEAEEA